jgi:hypothetical protein
MRCNTSKRGISYCHAAQVWEDPHCLGGPMRPCRGQGWRGVASWHRRRSLTMAPVVPCAVCSRGRLEPTWGCSLAREHWLVIIIIIPLKARWSSSYIKDNLSHSMVQNARGPTCAMISDMQAWHYWAISKGKTTFRSAFPFESKPRG